MKLFLDTADTVEIRSACKTGVISGVTTNPSLLAKEGDDPVKRLREICEVVKGPVSAEVTSTECESMVSEAKGLAEVHPSIIVKIPLTVEGVKAMHILSKNGVDINATLIFSVPQALIAIRAGAKYISPFVGRLDDLSTSGMNLVHNIVKLRNGYNLNSQIIVASIRSPQHVLEATITGADISTIPPKVFWQLFKHPLTDIGLEKFLEDWRKLKG